MTKLVTLRLKGSLDSAGFQVDLEISSEGDRLAVEASGQLPEAPELLTQLETHWLEKYRPLSAPYRIKSKGIEYGGSIQARLKACQESGKTLRDRLNTWLDAESFRDIDRLLRQQLKPDDDIRVLIRTNDTRLHKLPWHLWSFCESYPKTEIALSPPKFQRRERFSSQGGRQKIRILAILGHRENIDVTGDRQTLKNLPGAEVKFLDEPTQSEINDQLWDQPWDIIFFAGHSETEGDEGRIHINPRESLTVDELWYALRKAVNQGLQVAIFNSCDGLGLARRLDDLQIPITIVMRELIPDQVAHKFLKYFLLGFADGKPFYQAVREARERLQGMENEFPCASWLPVICQHPWEVPPTWQGLLTPLSPPPFRKSPWWSGLGKVLVASMLVTSLVMGGRSLGWLEQSELSAWDALSSLRPSEPPDHRLLLVKITEADLRQLDSEPITNQDLLRVIEKIDQYDPRSVGVALLLNPPQEPGRQALIEYLQDHDRVISTCNMGPDDKPEERVAPLPGVSSSFFGFTDLAYDDSSSNNPLRRHILKMGPGRPCDTDSAFSLQLALHYLGQEDYNLEKTADQKIQIGDKVFPRLTANSGGYRAIGKDVKIFGGYQTLINYRQSDPIAQEITVSQVLDGSIDAELYDLVQDRIVLIGNENHETTFYDSPNRVLSHVDVHAHLISQILSAVLDDRPLIGWWSQNKEILWIWIWSSAGGLVAWFTRKAIIFTLGTTLAVGSILMIGIIFLINGVWIPTVPAILALVLTGLGIIFYKEANA